MSTRINKIEKSLDVIEEQCPNYVRARSASPKINSKKGQANQNYEKTDSVFLDLEINNNSQSNFTSRNSKTSKRTFKRSNSEFHTREK